MANSYNTKTNRAFGKHTQDLCNLEKKSVNMHIHIMICIIAKMALVVTRMNIDNLKNL